MYGSIVCLTDCSGVVTRSEEEAAYLSRLFGARLILLHVTERWRRSELLITDSTQWRSIRAIWVEEAGRLLEKKEAQLIKAGAPSIKKEIREGDTASELITVTTEQDVDLLVLPNPKSWPIRKFFAPDFMDAIAASAPCPVLWVSD